MSLFCLVLVHGSQGQGSAVYFTSKENHSVHIHGKYYYQFLALDSLGETVFYSVINLPGWAHYDSLLHAISGRPGTAGQFYVHILAHTHSDTASQSFMITVYDQQTTNILCLGNSITNGVDTFNSYRRDLWHMLHDGRYNFDFVGSWSLHHSGSLVPVPDFDMDHEGHSGWTFADMLSAPSWDSSRGNLHQWLNEYDPDLVLIELGTNDVFHCLKPPGMFTSLDSILQLLRMKNAQVKIFLAQIPPLGAQWSGQKLCGDDVSYAQAIVLLNKAIAAYAATHSTPRSPVIIVDQFTGVDPAKNLFDDIHPDTYGEKVMAERWFHAIRWYLHRL